MKLAQYAVLATADRRAVRQPRRDFQLRHDLRHAEIGAAQLRQLGRGLCGVFLLAHPDRALRPAVEELLHHRLGRGEQHLARPEHHQVAAEQHADVVRHRPRGVDVVRDDQERRVDLRIQVDDQLVQQRGAHRVEPGIRLVEQNDLGIQHQRAGQPGPLSHAAGNFAGHLLLGTEKTDHLHLLKHHIADFGLALAGVLAKRERDVVVQVH